MSSGKDDNSGRDSANSESKVDQQASDGQLSDQDRNVMIQQAIRRRIIHNEIKKIQAMSLRQIIEQRRKKIPEIPIGHPDYSQNIMQKAINPTEGVKRYRELDIQDPTRKHLQLIEKSQKSAKKFRYEMKQNPIYAMIKRGKLGTDTLFILFAVLGGLLLPTYFYFRFQENRKNIIKNRKLSPQAIEALDQQSPFNIDDYSDQMVMYENPSKLEEQKKSRKIYEEMTKLRKDLDL